MIFDVNVNGKIEKIDIPLDEIMDIAKRKILGLSISSETDGFKWLASVYLEKYGLTDENLIYGLSHEMQKVAFDEIKKLLEE